MPRRLTSAELKGVLAYHTGSQEFFRYALMRSSFIYTEGVRTFCEEGGNAGAYWFLDIVATEVLPAKQPFALITINVNAQAAVITGDDGDGNIFWRRAIDYTDLQEGQWKFYFVDNTLLLPSEY